MTKETLVSEHKTPVYPSKKMKQLRLNALESYFGDQLTVCGYCGGYHHKHYICFCGYDKVYADKKGSNGELIEVWVKVR